MPSALMDASSHLRTRARRVACLSAARYVLGCALALCALSTASTAHAQEGPAGKTYAVIVAHNASVDRDVAPLRYADDDGARYWEIFSALTDDVHLLTVLDNASQRVFEGLARRTRAPSRAEVLRTLGGVRAQLARDREAGIPTTLFVVFTGHGAVDSDGMGYLSLADGRFTRDDLLREVIEPQAADRTHLIIDACNAYYMVKSRDGSAKAGSGRSGQTYDDEFSAFLARSGRLSQASTVGVFLSTAGAAEVHEWSRFGGGVFSHQLRSGLLGAADANGDLQITYRELEAYLAAANAAVSNPRARIQVFAQPPAQARHEPLLRLGDLRKTTLLEIGPDTAERYHLEDSRGIRYADLHPAGDGPMRLALIWDPLWRAPHYFLRTDAQEARVQPDSGLRPGVVEARRLSFVARADATRGSVSEAFRAQLFATPYGRSFFNGYRAAMERVADQRDIAPLGTAGDSDGGLHALGFRMAYTLSPEIFDLQGLAHGAQLSADLWWTRRVALRLVGQYTTSDQAAVDADSEPFRLHRLAFGVGLGYRLDLPTGLFLGLDASVGQQWLIHDAASATRADALALRADAGASLGYEIGRGLSVVLRAGPVLDVVTVDDGEQVEAVPQVGFGVSYRR